MDHPWYDLLAGNNLLLPAERYCTIWFWFVPISQLKDVKGIPWNENAPKKWLQRWLPVRALNTPRVQRIECLQSWNNTNVCSRFSRQNRQTMQLAQDLVWTMRISSALFFTDVMMINQSPKQHQAFKQQRHLCGYRNFFRIFLMLQKQRSMIYDYLDYWNRPQLCSTTKLFQTIIPPGKSPIQACVWTLIASL